VALKEDEADEEAREWTGEASDIDPGDFVTVHSSMEMDG
jgi:hypothetical protein